MKSFLEFINENWKPANDHIVPLQILMRGTIGLTSKEEDFTKDAMKILYDDYIKLVLIKQDGEYNRDSDVPENRRSEIDFSLPILNFTSTQHRFLLNPQSKVFNQVSGLQFSADKKKFHQEFEESDFVPKAVYNLSDINQLEEPIIAKPADGFSAQGIELFDTAEDAKKSKLKFDIWSEAKDIDREFRAFIMNNEVILISERITNSSNDQSVGKKDADDKIDLVYIDQELNNFPHINEIKRIANEVGLKAKLEFYNLDLILDVNGKLWVPEINGAPGIGPSMFWSIYQSWMKMHAEKIGTNTKKDLIEIMTMHRKNMAKRYPKEYQGSLMPIKS